MRFDPHARARCIIHLEANLPIRIYPAEDLERTDSSKIDDHLKIGMQVDALDYAEYDIPSSTNGF